MLVLGKKERHSGSVSVRSKSKGDLGLMSIDEFVAKIKKEVENRT